MKKTARSNHFDGKRFFNPTLPNGIAHSWRSTLKMARERSSQWPAWVENQGVPRLNEMLETDDVAITFVNHATFLIQTRGTTILTTTHDLAAIEGIADRVGMLREGRLVLDESLEAVKERFALPLERIFADVTGASAGGGR